VSTMAALAPTAVTLLGAGGIAGYAAYARAATRRPGKPGTDLAPASRAVIHGTVLAITAGPRVCPDPANPGHVLAVATDPGVGPVLVCRDATSGEEHRIPVPEGLDPLAAAAWMFDNEDHPVRCTQEDYARLERAT